MVLPASLTVCSPARTCSTESLIKTLISLAAVAERWASERTSEATTAKPRPCSPARAAAAFRARMLVWKAMPSITLMMSTIFCEEALMALMVWTTCSTMAPPRPAISEADCEFVGLVGVVGVVAHAGGQFLHGGGGLFQRAGLRFGALRGPCCRWRCRAWRRGWCGWPRGCRA
jgi:hypothetical protein